MTKTEKILKQISILENKELIKEKEIEMIRMEIDILENKIEIIELEEENEEIANGK